MSEAGTAEPSVDAGLMTGDSERDPGELFQEAAVTFHQFWMELCAFTNENVADEKAAKATFESLKTAYEAIFEVVNSAGNSADQGFYLDESLCRIVHSVEGEVSWSVGAFARLLESPAMSWSDYQRGLAADQVEEVHRAARHLLDRTITWLTHLGFHDRVAECVTAADALDETLARHAQRIRCYEAPPELDIMAPADDQWQMSPLESGSGRKSSRPANANAQPVAKSPASRAKGPATGKNGQASKRPAVEYNIKGSDDELAKLLLLSPEDLLELFKNDMALLERMVKADLVDVEPVESDE